MEEGKKGGGTPPPRNVLNVNWGLRWGGQWRKASPSSLRGKSCDISHRPPRSRPLITWQNSPNLKHFEPPSSGALWWEGVKV